MSGEPQGPAKLVAQLRKLAEAGTPQRLEATELETIATVIEAQERAITNGAAGLEKAMMRVAEQNTQLDRIKLVVRLCRQFLLTELQMPHIAVTRAFLRKYVDEGNWPPIPWPENLPPVCRFLAAEGYEPVSGYISKKEPGEG